MADDARYVLAKKIARGGMAEIYLGKHVGEDGFQRLCAIKRILPHFANDPEFVQMFRDEAHICKRLQHANIVRVEGFEEVEGSYAIIMEFVDGVDLRTLLHAVEQNKKRVPIPLATYIIAESARGLHYAHTKIDEITQKALGIVHRDISPQNILVSFEGEVKVTDFGIADAESKVTETRPGIVKGKYSYMSPEQISAKAVDARTDVFALSIVLWEMLSMRRLFQGENEVDTIQRVKNCRIDHELRQLNPEIDEELDQIVKKGLAKDLKKRFKSAAEFDKELRRYMSRRYPDFSPNDLGDFLKKQMESRRSETAAEIKKTLTDTSLRPGRKLAQAPGSPATSGGGKGTNVEITLDESQPALSLARPVTTANRLPANSQIPTGISNVSSISHTKTGAKPTYDTSTMAGLKKSNKSSGGIWFLAGLIAMTLAVGVFFKKVDNKAKGRAYLSVGTYPARVRIFINNRPVERGRYIFSPGKDDPQKRKPKRIELRPGTHTLTLTREGYHPVKREIELDEGDKQVIDDIYLKPKSQQVGRLRFSQKGKEGKPLSLDINNGYFVAKLGPSSVVDPEDLFLGSSYQVKVTPSGEKPFTCSITPRSTNPRQPNEVVIDRKTRKCVMTGP